MKGNVNPFVWVAYDISFHDHHLTSWSAMKFKLEEIQRAEH